MSFEEEVPQEIQDLVRLEMSRSGSGPGTLFWSDLTAVLRSLARERDSLADALHKANLSTDDQNKVMGEIEFILRNEAAREGRGSEGVPLPLNRMTGELQAQLMEKIDLERTVGDKDIALRMVEERIIFWDREARKAREEVAKTLDLFPKEFRPSGPALCLSELAEAYIRDRERDHEGAQLAIQGLQARLNQEQSEAHISGQMIQEAFDIITKHREALGIPEEPGPSPLSEVLESFIHDCKELKGPEIAEAEGKLNRSYKELERLRRELFDSIKVIGYQIHIPLRVGYQGPDLRVAVDTLLAAYKRALSSSKDFEKAFMDKRKEVEEARDILFATGLVEWSQDFTLPKALRKVLDSLEENRRTDPFKEGPCEQALQVIWEYLAEDTHADPNRSESPSSIAAAVGCRLREKRDAIYHRNLYKSSLEHIKERITQEIPWSMPSMEENLERLIQDLKSRNPQSECPRIEDLEKEIAQSKLAWKKVAGSLKSLMETAWEEGNG